MSNENITLNIKKTCKKCGKTLDISNFNNYKDNIYSPKDYCKNCEKLNYIANDLNDLIDIYGFGADFSKEDLFIYFENELITTSKIKLLLENGLIIKNQLTNKYHFTDIVTCNNFIKENLLTNDETDFAEILYPLDEKYMKTFNPKQVNRTGIAWVNFNGVTWIYQRQIKNNNISFSDKDIFKLHDTVIKYSQPWGVRDLQKAKDFLNIHYSSYIETDAKNNIYDPLPEEYEKRFNPKQASKTGIAWVTKNGNYWCYQRNVGNQHVHMKNKNLYNLYKEVISQNLVWGIRDYDKAKKYIKLPNEFKPPKKEVKSTEINTDIFAPLPKEWEEYFSKLAMNKTGIAWVNKTGNNWTYSRTRNGNEIRFTDPDIHELHKKVIDAGHIWGIRDFNKAEIIIKNLQTTKDSNNIFVTYNRTKKDELDIYIKGFIEDNKLIDSLNELKFFELDIAEMKIKKVKNGYDNEIKLNMNISLINRFEEKIYKLGWKIND